MNLLRQKLSSIKNKIRLTSIDSIVKKPVKYIFLELSNFSLYKLYHYKIEIYREQFFKDFKFNLQYDN